MILMTWIYTGLLAYRIWTIERNVSGAYAAKNNMPILRVLVDAALLYSTVLCASLVCFALSNNGFYVLGDLVCYFAVIISSKSLIGALINHVDRSHHLDCLLHGLYPRRNQQEDPRMPLGYSLLRDKWIRPKNLFEMPCAAFDSDWNDIFLTDRDSLKIDATL